MKSVHISETSNIETWLFWAGLKQPHEVLSIMIRPNTFKMVDGCKEKASVQKNQNWGYFRATRVIEILADKEIQRQWVEPEYL